MTDIKNLTPARFRCTYTISCPSVLRLEDGRLLIVGKIAPWLKVNEDSTPIDRGSWPVDVGTDESAIIIHPDLLSIVIQEEIDTERARWLEAIEGLKPIDDGAILAAARGALDQAISLVRTYPHRPLRPLSSEIEKATDPLLRENWQLKQALGYPIPAAFDTPQNPFKCGTCTARWNSFPSEIKKAVKAERERCAKIAYKFAEEADQGGKETPAGKQARQIGNAIRFSPVQGDEG
jgi:hypothetical protein